MTTAYTYSKQVWKNNRTGAPKDRISQTITALSGPQLPVGEAVRWPFESYSPSGYLLKNDQAPRLCLYSVTSPDSQESSLLVSVAKSEHGT